VVYGLVCILFNLAEKVMTARSKPLWTELPAQYINAGRTGILGVVLHDTAGTGDHHDTLYLQSPSDGRKVSVDFTVERDGSIWKLNPDLPKYYCNHAGRATQWRGYKNAEVNRVTVGIEITQHGHLSLTPLYPDAQVKSVANLCAWLTSSFGLAASDITTHRQIITDGSRSDPRKFPFDDQNGFWHYYWEACGKAEKFLSSLTGMDQKR
jgi:N-acetyl-anhydromuramyl-L-alanine amidase AmpD